MEMFMDRNHQKRQINVKVKLPDDALFRVFRALCDDLEIGQLAPEVYGPVRDRNVLGLLSAVSRFDPQSIVERLGANITPYDFMRLYQVGALIKKYPFKVAGIDRRSAAMEKFVAAEEKCRKFNTENYRALISLDRHHPKFIGVLDEIRKEIRDLIGDTPNIDRVYIEGRHGPGQTAGGQFKNGEVTKFYKLSTLPYTVTKRALPHAKAMIESDPRWVGALQDWYRRTEKIPFYSPINLDSFWEKVFQVVHHGKLANVPKTAVVDRTIGLEATLNIFLQLGVDAVIRCMLKSWGYDLDSQEKNQVLALLGSLYDDHATLDMAAASDTVSLRICALLLPPEWMWFLLDLRTDVFILKKKVGKVPVEVPYRLHKMSAMGNGFTFVLESLIFGALTRVAMRRTKTWGKSAVYGDDIVCPSETAPYLIELLELCGFSLNREKSFIRGPFRESCGKDFFNGHNVRPVFITDEIDSVPRLFHLINSFKQLNDYDVRWPLVQDYPRVLKVLHAWVPENFSQVYWGPATEDTDTHLFVDKPLLFDKDGYRYFCRLVETPHKQKGKRKDFFFRKLMVDLRGSAARKRPKWDWKRRFDTGNAFDITRRDATFFCCVRAKLPH